MATVVMDAGQHSVKAGAAGSLVPHTTMPCCVSRPVENDLWMGSSRDCWVGGAEQTKRGLFERSCPLNDSVILNWEDMERVWEHTFFHELQFPPDEMGGLLLSQPCQNPRTVLEQTFEIMFEQFAVPNLHVAWAPVLSLHTAGRLTGLSVDCGHGSTSVMPVFNGSGLPLASTRIGIGGEHVSDHLSKLLQERGVPMPSAQVLEDMKRTMCRCAVNFQDEVSAGASSTQTYELADGNLISLGAEAIRPGEMYFNPSLYPSLEQNVPGLPEAITTCVGKCAKQLQKSLFPNIVVGGERTN